MLNIMRPQLVWIEGRCYRTDDSGIPFESQYLEHDLYENDTPTQTEVVDASEDDVSVTMVNATKFKASFHVSKHYFGAIIGKKGAIKMRIERDTRTDIKIPKLGQSGDIIVFGPNEASVKTAFRRINQIVISSRSKQKPTHFISIPMNSIQIMESYKKFKETVLQDLSSRGLDETLFISPHKLHITVGVMCLMDQEERSRASEILNEAKDSVVMPILNGHLPLKLRLKGLNYMSDAPQEMNVLYGKVQVEGTASGVLQTLADELVKFFSAKGFMKENEFGIEHVKLHVTLLNTRYKRKFLERQNRSEDSPNRERISFDGTEILEKFGDYDFGVAEVTNIHLSQMNESGELSDEYYNATCLINLK